jgi:hypothetical protein
MSGTGRENLARPERFELPSPEFVAGAKEIEFCFYYQNPHGVSCI